MNKYGVSVVFFAAGTAAGFFVAKKLLRDRYEQQAQDEIDSVKAAFRRDRAKATAEPKPAVTEAEKTDYQCRVTNLGYAAAPEKKADNQIRIISPDEFGDVDYEEISLTYYQDHVLADERDHAMSEREIEDTVGAESLTHFGEYEPDSVFVRNDRIRTDFEILLDAGTYADVLKEKPYLTC